jgi:tRNA dimethylallyltransferase
VKEKKSLIVIAGPTAVGKTDTAIEMATFFQTEIVSADSRQIYREMNIGTAKPSAQELAQIPHHFINSHSLDEDYDAAQFGKDALITIEKIFLTRDYAVLVGGSGLYIKAVCEGFDDIPHVDENVRQQLVKQFETEGIQWLQEQMRQLDPEHLATIDQQNPHRLIRALEVRIGTGKSIASFQNQKKLSHAFQIIKIGLELPRDVLYARIDQRMDKMIASGLFDEAKSLYQYKHLNALQTVGYQEVFDYIDGLTDYEEAVRLLKRNSRRYAKRQLTWFKKDPEFTWFHPDQIIEIQNFIAEKNKL